MTKISKTVCTSDDVVITLDTDWVEGGKLEISINPTFGHKIHLHFSGLSGKEISIPFEGRAPNQVDIVIE